MWALSRTPLKFFKLLFPGRVLCVIGRLQVPQVDLPGSNLQAELHGTVQREILVAPGADPWCLQVLQVWIYRHIMSRGACGGQFFVLTDLECHAILAVPQGTVPILKLDFLSFRHGVLLFAGGVAVCRCSHVGGLPGPLAPPLQ